MPFASAYKDVFAFGMVIVIIAIKPTRSFWAKKKRKEFKRMSEPSGRSFLPSVAAVLAGAVFMVFFLAGESQMVVFGLLLGAGFAIVALKYLRVMGAVGGECQGESAHVCLRRGGGRSGRCPSIFTMIPLCFFWWARSWSIFSPVWD